MCVRDWAGCGRCENELPKECESAFFISPCAPHLVSFLVLSHHPHTLLFISLYLFSILHLFSLASLVPFLSLINSFTLSCSFFRYLPHLFSSVMLSRYLNTPPPSLLMFTFFFYPYSSRSPVIPIISSHSLFKHCPFHPPFSFHLYFVSSCFCLWIVAIYKAL